MGVLERTEKYWGVLGSTESTRKYWDVLVITGQYLRAFGSKKNYWKVLESIGEYYRVLVQGVLGIIKKYW